MPRKVVQPPHAVGDHEARGGAPEELLHGPLFVSNGSRLCGASMVALLERPRWLPQEVIRIDDPGSRPFPRCFCSKKITVSTHGTLSCEEFRHKQRRQSPASMRGWRGD